MNVGLKPYAAMEDSELPWLGEIPAHWRTERAKWLFRKMDRPVRESDDVVTCFRDGTVTLRRNRRVRGFTESLKEIGYQGIRRGDLVIHAMDAFAGAIGVADADGKGTPVYSVCEPRPMVGSHYYAYLIREMARSQWIQALAKGIRERSTDFRFEGFGSQHVPLPPLSEQAAIAQYLAYADRRIRRYIRAKQKLIKLLEEQKQAIIHRAVTRGLDPTVRVKPSGVAWLGDVPVHWTRYRLKALLRPIDVRSTTGAGRLLSLRREHGVVPYDEHFSRPFQAKTLVGFKIVESDQLVVNRLQANNGLIFRSPITGLVSPDYSVFERWRDLDLAYLQDLLRSQPYRVHFRRESTGLGTGSAGFLRLYDDRFLETPVFLPPPSEQEAIRYSIQQQLGTTNVTIEKEKQALSLVSEYRARLIADVVTGKLDVREVATRVPDESGDSESLDEAEGVSDADQDMTEDAELEEVET